jgi:hypothetical protein
MAGKKRESRLLTVIRLNRMQLSPERKKRKKNK